MNRKFQNTISALMTSTALLVLGLAMSTATLPMPGQPAAGALPLRTSLTGAAPDIAALAGPASLGELATATALAAALDAPAADVAEARAMPAADAAPRRSRTTVHRQRQTLGMPFFSFAPRG